MRMNIVKSSTDKHNGKPLTGDKYFGIETVIRLYDIEDSDKAEEGE